MDDGQLDGRWTMDDGQLGGRWTIKGSFACGETTNIIDTREYNFINKIYFLTELKKIVHRPLSIVH
jgi:hypothetical protein